jgi:hypothetical protein
MVITSQQLTLVSELIGQRGDDARQAIAAKIRVIGMAVSMAIAKRASATPDSQEMARQPSRDVPKIFT